MCKFLINNNHKKIIICDDEKDFLHFYAEILDLKYYYYNNNKWKRKYRKYNELYVKSSVDLILVDYILIDMDGESGCLWD